MRAGEVEVGLGDPALAVGRQRQADLVPAVDEDVRVVVARPRPLARPVDERDRRARSPRTRGRARSRRPRGATVPRGRVDLVCARSAMPTSPAGIAILGHADREPRAPRDRAAVRARPRRRGRRASPTSATTPPRVRDAAHGHPRPARARASPPARSTPPCASGPSAARRSTRSTSELLRELAARPDRHAGAVRGLRRLLRRRARGRRSELPIRRRRSSRWTRTTLGETMGDVRTIAQATGAATPALDLVAPPARAHRPRAARRARARRRPRRRARVARPGVRRRPLDAAADRAGRRRRRARLRPASTPSRRPGRRSPPPQPEVVVVMPCGYDAARALEEATTFAGRAARARARGAIVAVDASAYFSRPGPRLVDGLELLAHVLHPDRVAAPRASRRRSSVPLAPDGGSRRPVGPLGHRQRAATATAAQRDAPA